MRGYYMLGTALFIGFVFFGLKLQIAFTWVGLFAYEAILGFYGEINRRKLIFPILGLISCIGLSGFELFQRGNESLHYLVYLGVFSAAIWNLLLIKKWKNPETNHSA